MNNAPQVAVGAPAMLGLAERWGGAAARAADMAAEMLARRAR
jgi:hypothetical protein